MQRRSLIVICLASAWCISATIWAVEIPVLDSSFEELSRGPSSVPVGPREWAIFSVGGGAGIQTLDPPLTGRQGPDVGFLEVDNDSVFAVAFLDATTMQEGTYSTTVALAHQAGAEPTVQPFKINYEQVGFGTFNLLGANLFPVGTANSTAFTDVSADLTIGAGSEAVGKYLRLVLVADSPPSESATARYLMDNVRMTFTPSGGGTPESVFLGESSFQPTAWHRVYTDGGSAGQHRPATPLFNNQVGDQLGFATISSLGGFAGFYQDHGTIQAGTYTLTAGAGIDATSLPADSYVVLKFEALGPGFKEIIDEQSVILPSELNSTSLAAKTNVVVIEADSPLIGMTLRSVMVVEGAEVDHSTYYFDDVTIDFAPLSEPLLGDGCFRSGYALTPAAQRINPSTFIAAGTENQSWSASQSTATA
jgi:hypothetical protein